MKRIAPVLSALALVPALAACQGGGTNPLRSHAVAPTSSSSSSSSAPTTALRSAHTVKVMVDDMHLPAKSCTLRVKNADAGLVLPDPNCTPGAIDTAVTQDNIDSTICASGYTATVRPANSVTVSYTHLTLPTIYSV